MKLHLPKLPPKAGLEPIQLSKLLADTSLDHALLANVDGAKFQAKNLSLDESWLEKVMWAEAKLEKLGLCDTELRTCDLSAVQCSNASFIRVRITGSRLTGIDLSRSTLKDVIFENCKMDMANFRVAKLTRVQFVDCLLTETDFQGAELRDVSFHESHLEKTEFGQCTLQRVDARGAQLLDIRGWQFLRGLTLDSTQLVAIAPQLALALGLLMNDEPA